MSRVGARCGAAVLLDSVATPEDRVWLAAVIDGYGEYRLPPFQTERLLASVGFVLSTGSIRRHRRRLTLRGEHCRCPHPNEET